MKSHSAIVGAVLLLAVSAANARPVKSGASVQLRFGVEMALKGSWREAAFRFEKSLKLDPDNAYAQNNLGVACENIGEFEKAKTAYEQALSLDPKNARIRENKDRLEAYLATRNLHTPAPKPPAPSPGAPAAAPPAAADPNQTAVSPGGSGMSDAG